MAKISIFRELLYKIQKFFHTINIFRYAKNLYICLRYPFMRWYGDPLYSGYPHKKHFSLSYTWFNEIPKGWRKAFGKQLLKDIKKAGKPYLKEKKWSEIIFWEQIKEKYGELRLYASTKKDIQKVLDRYELMSSGYCISCGRPARYCSKGWIEFYCDRCFEKFECWRYENQGRTYKRVSLSKEEATKWKEECRIDESYIPKLSTYKHETFKTKLFNSESARDADFEELVDKYKDDSTIIFMKGQVDDVYTIEYQKVIKETVDLKEKYGLDFYEMWGLDK